MMASNILDTHSFIVEIDPLTYEPVLRVVVRETGEIIGTIDAFGCDPGDLDPNFDLECLTVYWQHIDVLKDMTYADYMSMSRAIRTDPEREAVAERMREWKKHNTVPVVKEINQTFTVTFSNPKDDTITADDLRDMILDSVGFPLVYDDHPEYLTVMKR
jgi:hypothetical protein